MGEEERESNHEFTNNREWTSDARHQTSAEKGKRKLNTNCECVIMGPVLNLIQGQHDTKGHRADTEVCPYNFDLQFTIND
jgi:hypothetical protein